MTKDQYFEMCQMVGSEPKEDEIPVEFEDLCEDVQHAILIYNMLQDNWDSMNGHYLGKSMAGVSDVFEIMDVDDYKSCFFIIKVLDAVRSDILNKKTPAK